MEEKIKTIAIFMGLFQDDKGFWGFKNTPERQRCHSDRIKDIYQYDRDWNWLMKVVEKITSILMLDDNFKYNYLYIGYDFEDKEHYVNLYVSEDIQLNGSSKNSKIEATYEAVVKFINFYNKQKEE